MSKKDGWKGASKSVPPLKLVPFLPQDNGSDASDSVAIRANTELGRCLALPFPAFLNFVLKDASLGKFVDTFLRFRRRHYELPLATEEPQALYELGRRVALVLLRAVGPEHATVAKAGKSSQSPSATGHRIVSRGGLLAPAAVLDVCALYERSNPSLVAKLLRSLGDLDGGAVGARLADGLEEAGSAAARALGEVHAKVAGANEGVAGIPLGRKESSDLLSYVVDVAATLGSLLQAFSSGADEGGHDWAGPGGSGPLALRFQGADGEVAPEGVAAALALTFEATLPSLEDLLLGSSGKGAAQDSPPSSDDIRARGRIARQWLLRCLHWLLVPVFLQPLGLHEASSKARDENGAGDRLEDAGVTADGMFRFVDSVTAASSHLALPGHAGSLLGEYNKRFRLADALEQADALADASRTAGASRGDSGGHDSQHVLGGERAEYLVGVLRGLPVSGEAVDEKNAYTERGAATARAFASALEISGTTAGASDDRGRDGGARPHEPEQMEEMVKAVQAVLGGPDEPGGVGEGFVEACLSLLKWSPQAVIGAVLEGRLPPQVAGLDRGLRRAWKGKKGDLDKAYRVDKDLAAAEAKRLIALEKRQEDDAYLLSREYDDDYDDQYDDYDVDVGGGAAALGDDLETVRRVNRLLLQEEEEDAWWDSNRNTNLSVPAPRGGGRWRGRHQEEDRGDAGEQGTGADQASGLQGGPGRGRGRGPGPGGASVRGGRGGGREARQNPGRGGRGRAKGGGGRGGRGGAGEGADGDGAGGRGYKSAEWIQHRRKEANKAAVGNHNRRNAARKKEAKGMF